jgi:hypothetical protein
MGRILGPFLGILAVASLLSDAALGQERFPCEAFKKNADGSLSVVKDVIIPGPNGSVPMGPGMSLPQGGDFMGLNLMALHDKNCR